MTEKHPYFLEIRNTALDERVWLEAGLMTDREAESRIGDLWNEYAAHLPDRGMRGTARVKGERTARHTIEG